MSMAYKYAFTGYDATRMARAQVCDAGISFKKSLMLAKALRGMMSDRAERYLEDVASKRQAVPFTQYANGAGHRRGGMAAGKYPVKAATEFLNLLRSCVANAENKGLGTPLKIVHVTAQEGSRPMRPGRQRGHMMKRTHIELVLMETEESKKRERRPKRAKKEEKETVDGGRSAAHGDAAKPAAEPEAKPAAAKKVTHVHEKEAAPKADAKPKAAPQKTAAPKAEKKPVTEKKPAAKKTEKKEPAVSRAQNTES